MEHGERSKCGHATNQQHKENSKLIIRNQEEFRGQGEKGKENPNAQLTCNRVMLLACSIRTEIGRLCENRHHLSGQTDEKKNGRMRGRADSV
jgi:hypothetical protein